MSKKRARPPTLESKVGPGKKKTEKGKVLTISLAGDPSSCLVRIGKSRFRALVDTGAEMSLIHVRAYNSLKKKFPLEKSAVRLQDVSGGMIKTIGTITVPLRVGQQNIESRFLVVDGINRNLILGRDWLAENKVTLYYNDLKKMKVGSEYVPLEEDSHISALVRLTSSISVKPKSVVICNGKTHKPLGGGKEASFKLSQTEKGYVAEEPGLELEETVTNVGTTGTLPIMLVNKTDKMYRLRRGAVVGKLEHISVIATVKTTPDQTEDFDPSEVSAPEEYKSVVTELIEKNSDLFAQTDHDLGHTDTVKMKIDTGDHPPIRKKPYRVPLNKRKTIDKAIDDMLEAGIIQRSRSSWAFPVVCVDKKDGTKRFCVDFRALNAITKPISYPLPLIDDILLRLGQSKYFTTLDLKSGYWQVLMEEEDREKTAFTCQRGLFEFIKMPFGLSGAPPIFMELMDRVLEGLEDCAIPYLDDIIVLGKTPEEHLRNLETVFERLRAHGLKMKLKKCQFFQQETKYLGFVVNGMGVKPDPEKVEAIRGLATPRTVKEVRGFIGMCGYYRRFVPNFSEIASPLFDLTKKFARFIWTPECQKAFDFLKDSLTVVPLLAYPDTRKSYTLYTDASDTCIGACLTQRTFDEEGQEVEKPLHFLSHRLSPTQRRWSTIEKEAYAIHFSLQKLDHYLHNAQFTIKTDHKPLRHLLEAPMQNKKIQLWALSLSGYQCRVEYIAGTTNTVADLLSRSPTKPVGYPEEKQHCGKEEEKEMTEINDNFLQVNALNSNRFDTKPFAAWKKPDEEEISPCKEVNFQNLDMKKEQEKDEKTVLLKKSLVEETASRSTNKHHVIEDDLLYYVTDPDGEPLVRLYIPEHLELAVIGQYHDDNGHMGVDKTYEAIKAKYYIPCLYQKLTSYIAKCVTCQTRSLRKQKPPLGEMEQPPYPFAKISMDISGPYPTSLSGNRYVLSLVDHYSGWPEAYALPDKTAQSIAHVVLDEFFPRYGCPCEMVTDNGTENENQVMREVFEELKIHHVKTSFYHPQSNAKVERFHRTLHDVLSKRMKGETNTWDLYLNQALAAIRFNHNDSSKFSPYFLAFNREVMLPIDNILKPRRKYQGEEQHKIALEQQHKLFTMVCNNMKRARKRQAKNANRNAKNVEFAVGDPVYLKVHQRQDKLQLKWTPYFRVVEVLSPLTYRIRNQLDGRITTSHAEHLRLATVDEWDIPVETKSTRRRKATYVVTPPGSDSDSNESSTEDEEEESKPMEQIAKRYRKERDDSDEEDDIPLLELKRRLQARERRLAGTVEPDGSDSEPEMMDISACHRLKRRDPMKKILQSLAKLM